MTDTLLPLDPSGPVGPSPTGQYFYGPTILSDGRARFSVDGTDRLTGRTVVETPGPYTGPTGPWAVTIDGDPYVGRYALDGRAVGFEPVEPADIPGPVFILTADVEPAHYHGRS